MKFVQLLTDDVDLDGLTGRLSGTSSTSLASVHACIGRFVHRIDDETVIERVQSLTAVDW